MTAVKAVDAPDMPVLTARNWYLLGVLATLGAARMPPTFSMIRQVTGWAQGTITAQLAQLTDAQRIRVLPGKPQRVEILTHDEVSR